MTEFNILDYKVEELQTREGGEVLFITRDEHLYLVVTQGTCGVRAYRVKAEGISYTLKDAHDIILKPKPKIQKAFFTYRAENGRVHLSTAVMTKEDASAWCNLVDWPAKLDRIFEEDM